MEIYIDRHIRKASERYECPVLQTSCYLVSAEMLSDQSGGRRAGTQAFGPGAFCGTAIGEDMWSGEAPDRGCSPNSTKVLL